jgi:hypothetical protein
MTGATAIEVNRADRSDLPQREVGILGFQIHDQLAHHDRQGARVALPLGFGGAEEAEQALSVKGIRDSAQGMFSQAYLFSAFLGGQAKKNDGANSLIQALFWRATPLLNQGKVIGALPPFSFRLRHGLASLAACRLWELL